MTHALGARNHGRRRTVTTVPTPVAEQHRPAPGRDASTERPLPEAVRARMEAAFGTDFSGVTIREDGTAAELDAEAYTRDETITFRPGRYDLSSPEGLEVIAHELTHVVQQRAARVPGTGVVEDRGLEAEAAEAGRRAWRGEPVGSDVGGPSGEVGPVAGTGSGVPQTGVAQPMKRMFGSKKDKAEKAAAKQKADEAAAKRERHRGSVLTPFTENEKQEERAKITEEGLEEQLKKGQFPSLS